MRISRKKRPQKPLIPLYKKNDRILSPEVRLLDRAGENLGVMTLAKALEIGKEQEVDVVEINPKGEPPVCKLIDFTQFKYQKEKEARKQKAHTHVAEMKGIRLSIRISDHDKDIRKKQALKFLERGDKVRMEILLRGRERGKGHMAEEVIADFVKAVSEEVSIAFEQEIKRQEAGKVTAIITKR